VDDAFAALKDALQHTVRETSGISSIRAPIDRLCRCAHDEGIAPERLLIRLKQTIDSLPDIDHRHIPETSEMRVRIVSLAIDAYFSEAAHP
jgi:hypothetical protein